MKVPTAMRGPAIVVMRCQPVAYEARGQHKDTISSRRADANGMQRIEQATTGRTCTGSNKHESNVNRDGADLKIFNRLGDGCSA